MNRRKAIAGITISTASVVLAYSGYKWYRWNVKPDINYLRNKIPLLSALADSIIPATDSPGAAEAGVGEFIFMMVNECTEVHQANKFIQGLESLESYTKSRFNKEFVDCSANDKIEVLKHFQEVGRDFNGLVGKAESKYLGRPFFATLKEYTIMGYCTSELGATKGLSYLLIPGRYQGCVPLQPGQKCWATK